MPKVTKPKTKPIAVVRKEHAELTEMNTKLVQQVTELHVALAAAEAKQAALTADLEKLDRYKTDPNKEKDYIDDTYDSMDFSQFVGAMSWTVGKYFRRFGKKDNIVEEAYKIRAYANRFYDKVLLEANKLSDKK